MRSRHCDVCSDWHDLDKPWPHNCMWHYNKHEGEEKSGLQIIHDIQPYQAVGMEGKPRVAGRRQHRDEMRSRGLVEIGNEVVTKHYEEPPGRREDLKRALWEVHRDL